MKLLHGLILAATGFAAPVLAQDTKPVPLPPPTPRVVQSPCTSVEHRQFDFWIGEWDVFATGTKTMVARSKIESLYAGCAIRENWSPFSQIDGGSLNSYDPQDRKWRQVWVDASNGRAEFEGTFENGKMVLTGKWKSQKGNAASTQLSRMTFTSQPNGSVRQFGEASNDAGKTWAPTFDFTYWRADPPK